MKIKKILVGTTSVYNGYEWVEIPIYKYEIVWFWQ